MKMERVDDGLLMHVGNLLECMRTRKHPQSDIEYGHRSSSCCLLGNVALRAKEHLEWDVANQKLAERQPRRAEASRSRIPRALEAGSLEQPIVESRKPQRLNVGRRIPR